MIAAQKAAWQIRKQKEQAALAPLGVAANASSMVPHDQQTARLGA